MRNDDICLGYKRGLTQDELAEQYGLTKARVGQILKKAGLSPSDRPSPPKSERNKFIGINVSSEEKLAVQTEAHHDETSMSLWIAALVRKELATRGYIFTETKQREEDVKLPL